MESINGQMTNLKNAIGTLADVVSEEIEHIRRVVISGEVEQKIMQAQIKIEGLTTQLTRLENDQARYQYQIDTIREEIGVI